MGYENKDKMYYSFIEGFIETKNAIDICKKSIFEIYDDEDNIMGKGCLFYVNINGISHTYIVNHIFGECLIIQCMCARFPAWSWGHVRGWTDVSAATSADGTTRYGICDVIDKVARPLADLLQ